MNYRDYAQGDTIIGHYMRMMEAQETPYAYDFWCACWMIGVAMGRRIIVDRPRAPVRLNMYLVLVGESGVLRKSTAVNAVTRVTRRFLDQDTNRTVVLDGKITSGHLLDEMQRLNRDGHDASIALSIPELAATLGRTSAHDLPIVLTDLYDSPAIRRGGTRSSGAYTVKSVYVSLLGASTPAWLVRAVSPTVVEGGFTSRCFFIPAQHRKQRIAWPQETDDERAEERIVDLLFQRADTLDQRRTIETSAVARDRFTRWYAGRRHGTDIFRSSFDSRADAHVLRLAGILAISDGTMVLHARHIEQAIRLVERVREDGSRLFAGSEEDRIDPIIRAFDKLRRLLVDAGRDGIAQGQLVLRMGKLADADHILRMLNAMHELDMVQMFVLNSTAKGGRRKTIWRGTKLLYGKQAVELAQLLAAPTTVREEENNEDGVH